MKGYCRSNAAFKGMHEPTIDGDPYSEMTWYRCTLCGEREPRGAGVFYGKPRPKTPLTLEERIAKLEEAK